MTRHFLDLLRTALLNYGYWAVAVVLLLENAGLPVPGETILLLASFLAYSQRELQLPWIIVVAIASATVGDNLGYWIGGCGGRRLLESYRSFFRVPAATLERGEKLFAVYGAATILFARFIFGMRVIAGPLAGVLRMPWRRFFVFNFTGAVLWALAVSLAGFLFGSQWSRLVNIVDRFDLVLAAVFVLVLLLLWRRNRQVGAHS
ncbi:MAG TPA: DedA family protein [Candidatus Aquilonibacter sp.]|nr:DedA family protein [Candidatus Aquilonibacter sp.]